MYGKIFVLISIVFLISCSKLEEVSIIPRPNKIQMTSGHFIIDTETRIKYNLENDELKKLDTYFRTQIEELSGLNLTMNGKSESKIRFKINADNFSDKEAYDLLVCEDSILISSSGEAGIFYGIQTLLQAIDPSTLGNKKTLKSQIKVPAMHILDNPQFKYRGSMLDVGRHYFPTEFIKRYIDILAFHKFNKFHWHLTEDQGWRIEIKKYPKLVEVGSSRKETLGNGIKHEGFYTQEDIKEIIQYAKDRFIEVIPEIEMPGHSKAALAAYPELSCSGEKIEVSTIFGVHEDIYCAGNEKTFEFLENILDEVIELFPSKYIHIGGDEALKVRWKKCQKCQTRIKNEKLEDEYELQSYFIKRIEQYLLSKGKYIIGWDEILEGGLAPNATVMSWRGEKGGIEAVEKGHEVIMSPNTHCYFDYYQSNYDEPYAIGGYTPLEKVYAYNPIPAEISAEMEKLVLGAQANLWTEFIDNSDYAEYMILPRLSALSEVLWTKKELKNFANFEARMIKQYSRYGINNWNYRVPSPIGMNGQRISYSEEQIKLSPPLENAKVKYTIDGTDPDHNSKTYSTPIMISESTLLKARTVMPDNKLGHVTISAINIVDTLLNGINYKYYEGNWIKLPEFSKEKVIKSGKAMRFSLDEIDANEDHFAVLFEGFLKIEFPGEYKFFLTSDDGSKLLIDGQLVIDNDGSHSKIEKVNSVFLTEGIHSLQLQYFDDYEGEALELFIEGGKIPKQELPASILMLNDKI